MLYIVSVKNNTIYIANDVIAISKMMTWELMQPSAYTHQCQQGTLLMINDKITLALRATQT